MARVGTGSAVVAELISGVPGTSGITVAVTTTLGAAQAEKINPQPRIKQNRINLFLGISISITITGVKRFRIVS
jgi:TctA family transporter